MGGLSGGGGRERLARQHGREEENAGKARVQMCWSESFHARSLIFTAVCLRQCDFGDPPSHQQFMNWKLGLGGGGAGF